MTFLITVEELYVVRSMSYYMDNVGPIKSATDIRKAVAHCLKTYGNMLYYMDKIREDYEPDEWNNGITVAVGIFTKKYPAYALKYYELIRESSM